MSYPVQIIPARYWGKTQPNNDEDVVTMHTLECPCEPGWAVSLARNWFQSLMLGSDGRSHPASATYSVDPANSVQGVDPLRIAWHCGNGNRRGIGIEQAGRSSMTRAQWLGDYGTATMLRAADLAMRWMKPRRIPIVWLSTEQTRNGARGINGHVNMSEAYGGSSHTDPGNGYPKDVLLQMVHEAWTGKADEDDMDQVTFNAFMDKYYDRRRPGHDRTITELLDADFPRMQENVAKVMGKQDAGAQALAQMAAAITRVEAAVAALTPPTTEGGKQQ